MLKTNVKQQEEKAINVEPILGKVLQDARQEHVEMQKVFELMGWGGLPDALKIEIKDDVQAMVDECEGRYSTCDPFVLKRRKRIIYWVENLQDNMCSLETAVNALRVKKL